MELHFEVEEMKPYFCSKNSNAKNIGEPTPLRANVKDVKEMHQKTTFRNLLFTKIN